MSRKKHLTADELADAIAEHKARGFEGMPVVLDPNGTGVREMTTAEYVKGGRRKKQRDDEAAYYERLAKIKADREAKVHEEQQAIARRDSVRTGIANVIGASRRAQS